MLAKAHPNIKKLQASQQKDYNIQTFNNPPEVDEKVVKKNMADDSHKVKMKTRWTGSFPIVEVSAICGIHSRINMAIFWKYISYKASGKVLPGYEDDMHEYVYKSMTTRGKEAHKQLSITGLLKAFLQNPGKHHMETDMEQGMTLDSDTLTNELAEHESPSEFENQMLEASDALITGEKPVTHPFFIPWAYIRGKPLQLVNANWKRR